MPNWCELEVEITFENKDEYNKFLQQADIEESTDPYLSWNNEETGHSFFDRFVPTPSDLLEGSGWWDWRINNWGTKWNPQFHDFRTDDEAQMVSLGMQTAWSPPREFFEKFAKLFPSVTIKGMYLEEGMNFCGRFKITSEESVDEYINDIPGEAYVELGAVLDGDGNVDWEKSEDLDPTWNIVESDTLFYKYYNSADNVAQSA